MMLAEGSVVKRIDHELEVATEDRAEAARVYRVTYGALPDVVTDAAGIVHELIGACESCGRPLFQGEYAVRWEDGVFTCAGPCGGGGEP